MAEHVQTLTLYSYNVNFFDTLPPVGFDEEIDILFFFFFFLNICLCTLTSDNFQLCVLFIDWMGHLVAVCVIGV